MLQQNEGENGKSSRTFQFRQASIRANLFRRRTKCKYEGVFYRFPIHSATTVNPRAMAHVLSDNSLAAPNNWKMGYI